MSFRIIGIEVVGLDTNGGFYCRSTHHLMTDVPYLRGSEVFESHVSIHFEFGKSLCTQPRATNAQQLPSLSPIICWEMARPLVWRFEFAFPHCRHLARTNTRVIAVGANAVAGPSFHLRMLWEIRKLDRTVGNGDGNQLDWERHLIWSQRKHRCWSNTMTGRQDKRVVCLSNPIAFNAFCYPCYSAQ